MSKRIAVVEAGTAWLETILRNLLRISDVENWIDARTFENLAAAIDDIGAQEDTLVISRPINVGKLTLTIPQNITLQFVRGGSLVLDDETININASINAGIWPIFNITGTGRINFGSGALIEIFPQWWGTDDDNVVTDVQIQWALDSVPDHGATVKFPEGYVYRIGAALEPKSNTKIIGSPFYESRIEHNTISPNCSGGIRLYHVDNVIVRNLYIDGKNMTRDLDAKGLLYCILVDSGCSNIVIEGNYVTGSMNNGIQAHDYADRKDGNPSPLKRVLIKENFCFENAFHGIGTRFVTGLIITGNNCYKNSQVVEDGSRTYAGYGIDVSRGSSMVTVSSNLISDNGTGLKVEIDPDNDNGDSVSVVVTSNVIENCISAKWYAVRLSGKKIVFSGNVIRNCEHDGIEVSGYAKELIIANNFIEGCKNISIEIAPSTSIPKVNDSLNGIVTNNIILNGGSQGIFLHRDNIIISGNKIENCKGQGIRCNGSYILVSENIIKDNKGFGIYLPNPKEPKVPIHHFSIRNNMLINIESSGNDQQRGIDIGSMNREGIVRDNMGYVTENSGTGVIPPQNTFVDVSHGLDVAPKAQHISIIGIEKPSNDPGNIYVTDINSSTFRVNVANEPALVGFSFGWKVTVV